ncbi:MAG: DUF5318 family protein [Nitriliruptorales bacterium]|nr:DUF5318 family protein [Nitriliruptorales bacterium]
MRVGRTDYRMQRRALLSQVRDGLIGAGDVCDAHPDLVRAGRHLGSTSSDPCPLCREDQLRRVTYVFDEGRRANRSGGGRAIPAESLASVFAKYGDLRAYTVEVCLACRWHHLLESFGLEHRRRANATSSRVANGRNVLQLEP